MVILIRGIGSAAITEDEAATQLRNRFHQDFFIQETDEKPVNEVLVNILTEILISPTGGTFGFGIPPGDIPARPAGSSARDYLDLLIGLTAITMQELSLRYRTNFMRPDSVLTNAVWENIYTLQGFFRDSFQSTIDPSHADPDILNQRIVPDNMQGKVPFFLEYDE